MAGQPVAFFVAAHVREDCQCSTFSSPASRRAFCPRLRPSATPSLSSPGHPHEPGNQRSGARPAGQRVPEHDRRLHPVARHDQGIRQRGRLHDRVGRLADHRVRRELCSRGSPRHSHGSGSTTVEAIEILLGAVLVFVAARQWRRRNQPRTGSRVTRRFSARLKELHPWEAATVGVLEQPWTLTAAAAVVLTSPFGVPHRRPRLLGLRPALDGDRRPDLLVLRPASRGGHGALGRAEGPSRPRRPCDLCGRVRCGRRLSHHRRRCGHGGQLRRHGTKALAALGCHPPPAWDQWFATTWGPPSRVA